MFITTILHTLGRNLLLTVNDISSYNQLIIDNVQGEFLVGTGYTLRYTKNTGINTNLNWGYSPDVHIEDIAQAHLKLIDYFIKATNQIYNIGTGVGTSVRRIFNTIDAVCKINSDPVVVGRRDGDLDTLISNVDKLFSKTNWRPIKTINDMIFSAWKGWQYTKGFSE